MRLKNAEPVKFFPNTQKGLEEATQEARRLNAQQGKIQSFKRTSFVEYAATRTKSGRIALVKKTFV